MSSSTPGIWARQLSVCVPQRGQPKTLLHDINLAIPAASFVAVIGMSGCGKSTLIRALAGIRPVSSGEILLSGHPVAELKNEYSLAVGYLPQFGAFHHELTAQETLDQATQLRLPRSVSRDIKTQWLQHIIELSRIGSFLPQPYKTLSGGQMRRLALAEDLVGDPSFLFLDELTSGLDDYSDQEMMAWLRDLAHGLSKTVLLVTHATNHLHYCDALIFLHQGQVVYAGPVHGLPDAFGVDSPAQLFALLHEQTEVTPVNHMAEPEGNDFQPVALKTAKPPGGWTQLPSLISRQWKLLWRDKSQIVLQLALMLTFPFLVAVFATDGLPQVINLNLQLESNIVQTMQEQLLYLKESFHAASLVSGLAMFQVILLSLLGANNGAREIAKERDVLEKELRAGLSPWAYVLSKFQQVLLFCLLQSFWMAWFVKTVCGFPASLLEQFGILFATTLAMATACLALSAASNTPERASLLSIYLVGFQLPLSGAALALPEWLSLLCRPFIPAYWGWSGYLKTFESFRHYDLVKQSTETWIAPYLIAMIVLATHVLVALVIAWFFVRRRRWHSAASA
ncbi:MAG: ATP-binding cassette domain-containing protein [Blastochloris sp.]|nr:ATP-binding cassette domain-containing protein [Blastochloris sp.]